MTALLAKVVNRVGGAVGGAKVQFFLGDLPLGSCQTGANGVCHIDVDGTSDGITAKVTVGTVSKTATIDPETESFIFRLSEIVPEPVSPPTVPPFWQSHFPAVSGIGFLLLAIGLTFTYSNPSLFQQRIILATFALAGGGFAAEIPGFLNGNYIRN
jgi:hypothetical protein